MPVDPSQLYSPGDFTATRKRIFEDSLDAVRKRFPIENTRYTLSLENVDYDTPHEFSLKEQKRAVQNDQSLSWKIKGNWVLTDKATGQVVSKSSRRTIMDIPYLTERGTFIRNGTEMTLPMQMRLVPGVYSRMGEDGMAKAHINARPGTGNTVMMNLNPAKPIFRVSVGTRNYDLFPLLKHNGISDDEIKAAWGDELFKINQDAFVNGGGWYKAKTAADNPDPNDPWEKASKDVFGGELDADNTTSAFGTAYTKVDPRLLLATSSRLIGLAKGTSSGDNRDSMENQRFFGPSDYIAERIRLDAGGLARNLLWRVSRYGDAEKIPSSPLSKYVHGLFTESNLSQAIEETNLLDAYKRATMVTRMGEGGIGSLESAPMSARLVHNTYKGFIDPISSPESLRVGLDTQIAHGAKRGRDGLVYSPVIDAKTGKKVYISSLESSREPVSFPEFRDSKDMLIPAMVGNEIKYLPKSDVKYFIPNGDSLFATASDFVPIKSGIKAGRLLMAQKHQTQAMSIKDRMAPYVQSLDPDGSGKSMEEVNSHIMGAVKAGLGGKVVRVTKDDITVLQSDGTRRSYSLYNNYPLNRKSVVNNTAKVKVGDTVQPGQLLASSSYTDENGVSALGTQLRSGWLSYKGWNYLDAIVVSESAAKKMTSEHFYHEGVDHEDGTEIGRDKYVAAFPSKFNRDQLATIDANGAVKPGTIVKKGDPLVLATSLRPGGPGTGYRALHKDVSSVWDHEFEGEVTDVVDGKDGMRVYVKAWVPLQVGDKMATRFANKGTCAAVIPDEKMPRGADGRPLEILFSPTGIVSRCYDPEHRFLTKRGWMFGKDVLPNDELWIYDPTTNTCRWGKQCDRMHVSKYKGELYGFKNEQVDFLVTKGHRIWTRGEEPWSAWRERLVEDVWGKRCVIPSIANRNDDPEATRFYLPPVYGINGHRDKHESELSFDAHDWAELLGWYLSEGNTTYSKERRQYNVNIAQSIVFNPDKVEHIRELLTRMGIKFSYSDKNMQFHIGGIRFAEYFKQFGYCYEKFIPDWLFKQPVSVMKRFLYSMWEGDGNVQEVVKPNGTVTHAINIGLTSEKLIEQIQTIITMCGTMCSRHKTLIDPRETYNYKPVYGLGVSSLDRQYRVLRNTSTSSGWYKVPYSGDVYCPSVETGYVVTMRNGKIACLGNTNSAALIEAALGKVAEKTGKRFVLPGFGNDLIALAKKELADAGLSDREDVTDPDTGRVIKGVFTGNSYVTKFHHTSESKGGARSTGSYTADEQPASGGHDGAKTLGGLVLGAFAGHGASEVLKDMKLIKGQKNTDFWRDFKMGKTPNMPGTPLIYKKFLAALEASGVHVTRKGDNTNIFAMTNKDVSNLARTEINSAATYDDKKFLPIKGGLFDPDIFGQEGDQWAKMKLDEPILNPIMDDVVCNFLNLKKADLDAVLSGSMKLPNGETGGEGLRKQLASLNLNTMIENAKHAIRSGPPSKRDKAVKTLRWASAMQNHDVTPDQFMLDEVPVLPPRYRRITRSGDLNMIADANFLYKELLDARDDLRKAKEAGLPDELLAYGRKRISDSFRAVTGLAEPQDRKMQESGVNGLLKWVFGKGSPKCHDDITEILTEDGWVNFKDYKNKSVKVATLNPITMTIEYQSPTDIIHEPYKGEMIEISNKEIDMCITHNHNVLLKDSREWSTHRAFTLRLRENVSYTFLGFDNTDLMKEVNVWYTDIQSVPYDGYVHCVTVPNGLIVTRRNGKASIGGNSGGLQRLVIGGKLDVAGRSVINVDPRLSLDEVGMPEKQAWGLYRDFVIRKLVQSGMSPLQATKSATEHAPIAKEALLKVMEERPVIVTRAPALHKFSVQAFRPKLVSGDVLKLNSVTEHAFNADFDGDKVLGCIYLRLPEKAISDIINKK